MSESSPDVCVGSPFWEEVKKNNLPDKLFNTVYYLTHNYHDAQDICQETFLAGIKNIRNFRGESTLSTYLYKIAINLCAKYRQNKKSNHLSQPDNIPSETPSPYERTLNADRVKAIKSALNTLPSGQKEVVVLKDIEGLTYQEISQALDMSIQTVRTNLANARGLLKTSLKNLNI